MTLDPALAAGLRAALALMLLSAARHKLAGGVRFRAALADYELLPERALPAAAALLLASEIALGVALLVPGWGAGASLGTAALLALYGAAIAVNLARGRRTIDCGCGAKPRALGEGLVARNAVLAGLALLAALPTSGRALGWIDAVTVVGCALALHALHAAAEAGLFGRAPAPARSRA